MSRHVLERSQLLRRPVQEVFSFFCNAKNLERITPPKLRFEILSPLPDTIAQGTVIDYRIALFGVPMGWRTLIESFEPPLRFVDVQARGPYKSWRHTHQFEQTATGTRMNDRVEYEMPLGLIGEVAKVLFVQTQLTQIFDFRAKVVRELLGGPSSS